MRPYMRTLLIKRVALPFSAGVLVVLLQLPVLAQSDTATLSGRITDVSGAPIPSVTVIVANADSGTKIDTVTNDNGIYVLLDLHPGNYQVTIEKSGFRKVILTDLAINVQDALSRNFTMQIGPVAESVVVHSTAEENNVSPAVSTLVGQEFVQNMPLNGRTFQSLLALTPGYVVTIPYGVQGGNAIGQLSMNGQRSNANYFMVDGMSWNFGIVGFGQSAGGTIPGFTIQGTTNGLVPVDAMQEFRVLTSTFSPEFGRTPGAQISIVTRSGNNQVHGTLFDYLRNNTFDARNYFDAPPLPKPPLRQNDFGGTVGAPIRKDRAFFFFSYEGLRLLLPETATGTFYTAAARAKVAPVYQPFLAALPIPNGPVNSDGITAPLTVAYSDPTRFDSYGLRIDYNVNSRMTLFGRYSRSPSTQSTHDFSELGNATADVNSLTVGTTCTFGPDKLNDFRANWSQAYSNERSTMVPFYGAVPPPASLMYPPDYNSSTYKFILLLPGQDGEIINGGGSQTLRQLEFADVFSVSMGTHQLKFGGNMRQLTPTNAGAAIALVFTSYLQAQQGIAGSVNMSGGETVASRTYNYSLFAQDVWRATSRLTLTYGLRWEINTPLGSVTPGKPLYNVNGIFNSEPIGLAPVSNLGRTRFNNFAPRIGASYLAAPQTIVRGGFGLFYDIGFGAGIPGGITGFPYQSTAPGVGPVPFDLTNPAFAPPRFSTVPNANTANLYAVQPNLKLPLVYEWNVAVERALGSEQSVSLTYVGSHGTNLLREDVIQTNPTGSPRIFATRNADWSNYDALQVQFQRHMFRGLQILASYTFGKSLDTNSFDDCECTTSDSLKNINVATDYGPSNFDIRHSFAAAISYESPTPKLDNRVANALLRGWALYGVLHISSAPPFDIYTFGDSQVYGPYVTRPDIVPNIPFYIPDPAQPGGRILNVAAFAKPALGQEGDLGRNYFRGFPVDQTDLAVSRRFNLTERLALYLRMEYFNLFNHPMFAPPSANFNNRLPNGGFQPFGTISSTLNNFLYSGVGTLSSLYQIGGPRSGQLTLKLEF
jgi:Carboxypeptidase regulatory-like domain/TonB dependent receptor